MAKPEMNHAAVWRSTEDPGWLDELKEYVQALEERVSALEAVTPAIEATRQRDEAMAHLRALLAEGCEELNTSEEMVCRWCRSYTQGADAEPHKPDCPYLAAKAFVEGLEEPADG